MGGESMVLNIWEFSHVERSGIEGYPNSSMSGWHGYYLYLSLMAGCLGYGEKTGLLHEFDPASTKDSFIDTEGDNPN